MHSSDKKTDERHDKLHSPIEFRDLMGTYGILVLFLVFLYVMYNIIY